MPWYAAHRDLPRSPFATTCLYRDLDELRGDRHRAVEAADLVVLGSYVPDGVAVARWMLQVATGVRAFYDIDTPVTLGKLRRADPSTSRRTWCRATICTCPSPAARL